MEPDPSKLPPPTDSHNRFMPEQIEIWRRMDGVERLRLSHQMYLQARTLCEQGVRDRHPDWNDDQVKQEVKAIFLRATT